MVFNKENLSYIHENCHLYNYCSNNPVRYVDTDGCDAKDIFFILIRDDNSKYSLSDKSYRALDIISFKNYKTGDFFNLHHVQSYVSHSDYPASNTLEAYMNVFSIQYLGNNKKDGHALFGGFVSNYGGPVFNVQNAYTKGNGITDEYGQIIPPEGDDTTPIRVHSNYNLNEDREVNMASGGCPMYNYEQADDFAAFLERNGVKPGDKIFGFIKEYFEP